MHRRIADAHGARSSPTTHASARAGLPHRRGRRASTPSCVRSPIERLRRAAEASTATASPSRRPPICWPAGPAAGGRPADAAPPGRCWPWSRASPRAAAGQQHDRGTDLRGGHRAGPRTPTTSCLRVEAALRLRGRAVAPRPGRRPVAGPPRRRRPGSSTPRSTSGRTVARGRTDLRARSPSPSCGRWRCRAQRSEADAAFAEALARPSPPARLTQLEANVLSVYLGHVALRRGAAEARPMIERLAELEPLDRRRRRGAARAPRPDHARRP